MGAQALSPAPSPAPPGAPGAGLGPDEDPLMDLACQFQGPAGAATAGGGVEEFPELVARLGEDQGFCVVLHGVLSGEECAALIARSEARKYEPALVNIGGGQQQRIDEIRKCGRCIIDSPAFAEELWARIQHRMGQDQRLAVRSFPFMRNRAAAAVGLNERMRFLRYGEGDYFAPHMDGCYERGPEAGARQGEVSLVTCQLYLNEGFQGGSTRFFAKSRKQRGEGDVQVDVVPKTGSVLLFQHRILHEGELLSRGTKYVIRTDVMYKWLDPAAGEEEGRAGA